MAEYFTAYRITVNAYLEYNALLAALQAGGMPPTLTGLIDFSAGYEPYSVLVDDAGGAPGTLGRRAVRLELGHFQYDAALNEIPQAVGLAPLGRDLGSLQGGGDPYYAVSVAEVLTRFLGSTRVPARVYGRVTRLANSGAFTPQDGDLPPNEDQVLFDGYLVGVAHRASASGRSGLVLAFTSWLSDLAASSALTANISAASARDLSFRAGLSPYLVATADSIQNKGAITQTPYGSAQVALGSGVALDTDFWGYWRPPGISETVGEAYGLQHWLYALARQDLFGWEALRTQAFGALGNPACATPSPTASRPNNLALPALQRIEPFSGATAPVGGVSPGALDGYWTTLRNTIRAQLLLEGTGPTFGLAAAITRDRLIAAAPAAYSGVGYRYGMPIPFRKADLPYGFVGPAYAFAADLASETLGTIGPVTLWDKLVRQYCPRYQLALAPLTTRAVVVPLCPALRPYWRTIYAADIGEFESEIDLPVPVRGVVLFGRRPSQTGATGSPAGQNTGDPALTNFEREQHLAAYDSCRDGQFIYREAPAWLSAAAFFPPAMADRSVQLRVAGNAPTTAASAIASATALVAQVQAILNAFGAVGGGTIIPTLALPTVMAAVPDRVGMAHAYAKALYQYERLRPRTCRVAGRFRTDIGPGSVVRVEIPRDKFADAAMATAGRERYLYGVVMRTSVAINTESQPPQATTAYHLGFVRREGELATTSDLTSDGHPIWGTALAGVPLVDTFDVRNRLGNGYQLG